MYKAQVHNFICVNFVCIMSGVWLKVKGGNCSNSVKHKSVHYYIYITVLNRRTINYIIIIAFITREIKINQQIVGKVLTVKLKYIENIYLILLHDAKKKK